MLAIHAVQLGLDCHSCDNILKAERGCQDKGVIPYRIDGEMLFRCPLKLISDISWEYINAFKFYKMNFLPNGVAWTNESRKFLDAMIVIDNELTKIENESIKNGRN